MFPVARKNLKQVHPGNWTAKDLDWFTSDVGKRFRGLRTWISRSSRTNRARIPEENGLRFWYLQAEAQSDAPADDGLT
jgi:hypothetical protein